MLRFNKFIFAIALFAVVATLSAKADTVVTVTVDSHAGPWLYANGGLNTGYQYGVNDHTSPTVVDASSGISFSSGSSLTITYLSGMVSFRPGFPSYDANGDIDTTIYLNDQPGSSGQRFPSYYINHSQYPAYLIALMGTFTDNMGAIVGTPFKVGNGPFTAIVPSGATRLQLGINDDIFSDNSGSFSVRVSGPSAAGAPVPEPATMLLLGTGLAGLGGMIKRRRQGKKE